ncbi:MAG: SIMPL domain-containing protein [Brevundimonas sp.]|jgi:uncharacterized protein YggE|uniref:SIMPL domain-containing protein n=1 Tax=Brevundimonas sp. TaxID=1871086 RepID=UPI003918C8F4
MAVSLYSPKPVMAAMTPRKALAAALMGAGLILAVPAAAQDYSHGAHHMSVSPTFTLSAYGEVRVAPDLATINFAVVTEAATAEAAMRQNRERMNQVMAALRRAGISERDIQTSGLNLSAQYDYVQNEPPRLRGYQATNQVTVRVLDLDRVGSTADAVVSAGVNQINGISFGLRDPQTAENAAREQAVRALQARAQLYANATGMRLIGLRSLTEGASYAPQPPMPMYARMASMEADSSTPVAPGELTLRITITGVYDVAR